MALVNPWVRTRESLARSYLRHYYLPRFFSRGLWAKIGSGDFQLRQSLHSLWKTVQAALKGGAPATTEDPGHALEDLDAISGQVQARMAEGVADFEGPVLLVLSGRDLTAREFLDTVAASPIWRQLLGENRVTQRSLPEADHTFSAAPDRDNVAYSTVKWLASW